jgi:hypothetical protein
METKELTGVIISVKSDTVFKVCYIKFLTESRVVTLKVTTSSEESRFQNYFDPTHIVTVEIVKTRKNWILKQILKAKKIHPISDYSKMLNLASKMHIVDKNLVDGQETDLLFWLVNQIKTEFKGKNEKEFEEELLSRLNFSLDK